MSDLPILIVDILPPLQGKQSCGLKLTLHGLPTNCEEKDAGELELPFPLDMMSIIQYLLNLRQENDRPSKLGPLQSLVSGSLKKPSISQSQENVLNQQLKLLDGMGRVVDDVHEKVGELLDLALLKNKVFENDLQEFYKAVGRTNGGDIVLRFNREAWGLTALPWELAFKQHLISEEAVSVIGCTRILAKQALSSSNQPLLSAKQSPSLTYPVYENKQNSSLSYSENDKLRILAVASYWAMDENDRNREELARQQLQKALKDIGIEYESKPHITMSALASRLDSEPPIDILDYFGHGSFEDGHAILAMEDDNKGVDPISPAKLQLLNNLPPLIILYACHSAQVDINNSFDSFAYSLINKGVQAVIAMQFKVRMQVVAEHVVWTFYKSLASEYSLPKALAEVRRKLLIEEKEKNAVSWFVPTLYMREFTQQPYLLLEPVSKPLGNPFVDPGAITDAGLFLGREEQILQLRQWLESKGHRSIVGPHGSGKSSMLTLLRAEAQKKLSTKNPLVKFVKLSPKRLWSLREAEKDLMQQLDGQRRTELQQKLRGKNLILLLDDVDKLAECKEGYDICEWLRILAEEAYDYTVRLVVTGNKPLKEMAYDYDMFRLLNQVIKGEIELGPFNENEARDFIAARLREAGNPFEVKDFEDLLYDPGISLIPGDLEIICKDRYEELRNNKMKRARILFRTFR